MIIHHGAKGVDQIEFELFFHACQSLPGFSKMDQIQLKLLEIRQRKVKIGKKSQI